MIEQLSLTGISDYEAYRFDWHSSFHGSAVVCIAFHDAGASLRWRYNWFRQSAPDDSPPEKTLSREDRTRLLDALSAAEFWTVDLPDPLTGLDGAQWLIEGWRGNNHRELSRFSPDAEIYVLGRLFFELAGPPLSKIELY